MKRLIAIALFSFAACVTVTAQQKKLNWKPKEEEWVDKPILHPVPPEYAKEPALIVLQDIGLDYLFEGGYIDAYYTVHRIVKVLDEKGIESFNAIGFSVGSHTRVPSIKARTIMPNGKVQDIAKDMIKVTRDEYGHHKIVIAMEGVAKDAEIELLVKEIMRGGDFGSEVFQAPVPILKAHFSMSYPKKLTFDEKGYNGFPNVSETADNNRRYINVSLSDVPALRREPNSFYDVNCMRVEYRLRHYINVNANDTMMRENTWDVMARTMFNEYYKINDTERKAVNSYLTELGVHPGGNEMENIRKIESGIKNNIVQYTLLDYDRGDMLDSIITKKAATSRGYIKLFAACLTQALVKHELGSAGNRTEHRFDSKFENWDNMDDYLFYFPDQKKFLSPTSVYYRCPMVPSAVAYEKGVFCMIPPKGPVTGPLMEVRKITPLGMADNQQNIAAAVTFNNDMDAQVDISYSYTGYAATDLRKTLLLETKDKQDDLVDKIVTIAGKHKDIEKYTITNEGLDNYYNNKPLEITATVNANHLVEKAGKEYLLNIGEIIGPQQELYTEKKRMLPIDMLYPHSLTRTITVNIPKGYKILNPEDTRLEAEYVGRNLVSLISFKSNYELITDKKNGDKLVVTITENYPTIHFPVADYERFREVINTASDFNKVTLLFAKKGGSVAAKAKPVAKPKKVG